MADKVLLIPGTSGNKLLLDGVDIGWPGALSGEAWLCGLDVFDAVLTKLGCSTDDLVSILSMEFADESRVAPTKTTLKAGSAMTPGPILGAAYNQFSDVSVFVYDWRSDIRDNGAKLLAHLEAEKPPNGRWKILTHSQGGLLVPVAARLLGQRSGTPNTSAFSQLVSHVGFCAVPFYGCINAADALANGNSLSPNFSAAFRSVVRTWPSLYQMLASWPGSAPSAGVSASLLDDAAWSGMDIDPALLARARASRYTYLRHPLIFLTDVKVRITLSVAHPTHDAALNNGSTLTPSGQEIGDTLVPYTATRAAMNDVERQVTYAIGGSTAEHFMLMNDPVIASDFRSFLDS